MSRENINGALDRLITDEQRMDFIERNPEAIRAFSIYKSSFGRKVWWQSELGDFDTLREATNAYLHIRISAPAQESPQTGVAEKP